MVKRHLLKSRALPFCLVDLPFCLFVPYSACKEFHGIAFMKIPCLFDCLFKSRPKIHM